MKPITITLIILVLLVLQMQTNPIAAAQRLDVGGALTVPTAYIEVAREYDVPANILFAIALTESGRRLHDGRVLPWPWVINVAGKAFWFSTRAESTRHLRKLVDAGIAPDVGLMQVNWKYHKHLLGHPNKAIDPWLNLRTGARVLRQEYEITRDWWRAVGRYHSYSKALASKYRERVRAWYRRLK